MSLHLPDLSHVLRHLWIQALVVLGHLLDNQLRVALDEEAAYPEGGRGLETSEQSLILRHVVGGLLKEKLHNVLELFACR